MHSRVLFPLLLDSSSVFLISDLKQNARSLLTHASYPAFHFLSHGIFVFSVAVSLGGNCNGQSDAYVQVILFLELPVRAIPNAPRERL